MHQRRLMQLSAATPRNLTQGTPADNHHQPCGCLREARVRELERPLKVPSERPDALNAPTSSAAGTLWQQSNGDGSTSNSFPADLGAALH